MMSVDVFFFNDTATTEIYTLSLHDALPISLADHVVARVERGRLAGAAGGVGRAAARPGGAQLRLPGLDDRDRKSTRLNSSHANISYAVFCLKKKKTRTTKIQTRRRT